MLCLATVQVARCHPGCDAQTGSRPLSPPAPYYASVNAQGTAAACADSEITVRQPRLGQDDKAPFLAPAGQPHAPAMAAAPGELQSAGSGKSGAASSVAGHDISLAGLLPGSARASASMRSLPISMQGPGGSAPRTRNPTAESIGRTPTGSLVDAKCSSFAGFAAAESPCSTTSLIPASAAVDAQNSQAFQQSQRSLTLHDQATVEHVTSGAHTWVGRGQRAAMQQDMLGDSPASGILSLQCEPSSSKSSPRVSAGWSAEQQTPKQQQAGEDWRGTANAGGLWPAGGPAQLQVQDREFFDAYFKNDEAVHEARMHAFNEKHGFDSWFFGVPFESQVSLHTDHLEGGTCVPYTFWTVLLPVCLPAVFESHSINDSRSVQKRRRGTNKLCCAPRMQLGAPLF